MVLHYFTFTRQSHRKTKTIQKGTIFQFHRLIYFVKRHSYTWQKRVVCKHPLKTWYVLLVLINTPQRPHFQTIQSLRGTGTPFSQYCLAKHCSALQAATYMFNQSCTCTICKATFKRYPRYICYPSYASHRQLQNLRLIPVLPYIWPEGKFKWQ